MTLPGFSAASRRDDLLARLAAARAHVDEKIRVPDYVQVVLNQGLEYPQQGVFPSELYTTCVMWWWV